MVSETHPADDIATAVASLGPSEHVCMSCHTPQEALGVAIPFIRSGLDRRERCVYIADDDTRPGVLDAMHAHGIPVDTAMEAGALTILGGEETYRRGGSFDPKRMHDWCREQADVARGAGFSGFRMVCEMTCVTGQASLEVPRLAEYERKLNDVLSDKRISALCVYERRRFTADIIREVIATHRVVVVGTMVCENPLFVPPDEYLSPDWPEREIDWLLQNLCARQGADRDLRESEQRYRRLARRLLEVQEAERRRIARDLHDDLGQMLTAIKMSLQATRARRWGRTRKLAEIIALVEEAMGRLRETTFDLRPLILDDLGLAPALRSFVDRQATRAGLAFHLDLDFLDNVRLPASVETTCFRLVQEALTNIIRHAHARRVDVKVRAAESEIEVVIHDDGTGFDVDAARRRGAPGGNLGLISMEERVALAGGRLAIESTPGDGTTVRARLPLVSDPA